MYEMVPIIIPSDPQEDTSRRPLPRELLTEVAAYCDPQTLIALSRVCRFLAPIAEYRIWKKLNLFLHPYYGECPLIQEFPRGHTVEYRNWAETEAGTAEEARRMALSEKVRTILCRGNETKWGMVEEVRVETHQGAVWGMMAILELVAPNVKFLQFVKPTHHPRVHHWRIPCFDSLEAKLVDAGIRFANLTSLDLQRNSVRNYQFLAVLINAAISLTTLAVHVSAHRLIPADVLPYPYPRLRQTSIRKLYLTFHDMVRSEDNAINAIVELLRESPILRQLSVYYRGDDRVPVSRRLAAVLGGHTHLRDLHWTISPELLLSIFAASLPLLGRLERLVVESDNAMDTSTSLESLWFEIPPPSNRSVVNWDRTAFPATHHTSNAYLTHLIRKSSSLETIRYIHRDKSYADIWAKIDSMDEESNISGIFSSVHRDETELVRARVFMELVNEGGPILQYVRREMKSGEVYYDKRRRAGWKEWAELEGNVVPLPIVERMAEMQGVQAKSWTGRERRISKEAWRIVEHWIEQEKAHGDVLGLDIPVLRGSRSHLLDSPSLAIFKQHT